MQNLEQLFLLLLIMGRWMMPKGKLTHNQLSQLLLVYLGDAADMVEFFDAFNEPVVRCTEVVSYLVLTFWSLSLSQFSLVIAEKEEKARKPNPVFAQTKERPKWLRWLPCKCTLDVTRITLSITLQDGPYLVLRMLLIFHYGLLTYTNLFFTAKNTLVIVLMIYRLLVVQTAKTGSELENRFFMGDLMVTEMGGSLYADGRVSTITRRKKRIHNISAPLLARCSDSRYSLVQNCCLPPHTGTMKRDASGSTCSLASRQTQNLCVVTSVNTNTNANANANERPKSRLLTSNCPSLERKQRPPGKRELDEADAVVQNLAALLQPPSAAVDEPGPTLTLAPKPAAAKKTTLRALACRLLGDGIGKRAGSEDSKVNCKPCANGEPKDKKSKKTRASGANGAALSKSESEKQLSRAGGLDQTGANSRPKLFLKRAYDIRATTDSSYVEPTLVVVDGKTAQVQATTLQRRASLELAASPPVAGLSA